MPDVHIRRTAAADLPALTRLWQTAFGDPPELIGAFYDRFPPEKVLSLLEEVRATGMMAQPTVYRMLTEVGMDRYDLSSITNFAVGGEKLSPDLAQKVTPFSGRPNS